MRNTNTIFIGKLKGKKRLEGVEVDERIILKSVLKKQDTRVWTGFIWLRKVSGGGLLWTRYWTFGFREKREISWLAERPLASQERVPSMELDLVHTDTGMRCVPVMLQVVTINGARMSRDKHDIVIPQGIAHAVDRVMFPLPVGNIVQTLRSDRDRRFSKFLRAIQTSGLAETFSGNV